MANDSCCLDSCCECNADNGDGKSSITASALDAVLKVNVFFGGFIFTGLSLVSPGQQSLQDNRACDAGPDIGRNLVKFEVFSFICFLVSTLLALGLKFAITRINCKDVEMNRQKLLVRIRKLQAREDIHRPHAEMGKVRAADVRKLRKDMFCLAVTLQGTDRARIKSWVVYVGLLSSAFLSALGSLFLVVSMVFLSETILGLLSCGSLATGETVAALIVFPALVACVFVIYAYACKKND